MRVQELPGGGSSSHKTLDVYTALRDPLTGDVRLFLEYYLKHPLHMTPKEREGPFPAFSEVFAGCLFSDHRNFSNIVEVPAKEVGVPPRMHACMLHPNMHACMHAASSPVLRAERAAPTPVSVDFPIIVLRAERAAPAPLSVGFLNTELLHVHQAHNSAPPGNGWLDCAPEHGFAFVRVLLRSGHVHGQTVRVENIRTERIGAVAACVAPLFSHRPDIHAWMYHMTQLGVGRFHMYLPAIHAHERDAYEAPHEVWMTVKDFNYREGETHTEPFHAFEHPLAVWHHYSPSNRENYFGQVGVLLCWGPGYLTRGSQVLSSIARVLRVYWEIGQVGFPVLAPLACTACM